MNFKEEIKRIMSFHTSNIIAINIGWKISNNKKCLENGKISIEKLKKEIIKLVRELNKEFCPCVNEEDLNLDFTISKELSAGKGSYVVIAGVFNGWYWSNSSEFSKKLSKKFETEVMHSFIDEDDKKRFEVYRNGINTDDLEYGMEREIYPVKDDAIGLIKNE